MTLGFHIGGQKCRECHDEIRPTDVFHTLEGEPGRPVQFVHAECCQDERCRSEEEPTHVQQHL